MTLPVAVSRDGRRVCLLMLTTATSSRRDAAKTLRHYLGDSGVTGEAVAEALDALLVQADAALAGARTGGGEGTTLQAVVRDIVLPELELVYRTGRGTLWSEARGREVSRPEVLACTTSDLMDAAAGAVDAPRDQDGRIVRGALLRAVQGELAVLWADAVARLPLAEGADLGAETEAGRQFRAAVVRLWTLPRTFEVSRGADGADSVASRASLVRRAAAARDKLRASLSGDRREAWHEVQPSFAGWWRCYPGEDGELLLALAMRHVLAEQVGVELPGVRDGASLTALGRRYGVLTDDLPVPQRASGGHRLAILAPSVVDDLLAAPVPDDPDTEPVTEPGVTEDWYAETRRERATDGQ